MRDQEARSPAPEVIPKFFTMVFLGREAPEEDGVPPSPEALVWQSIMCKWLRLC